MAVREHYLGGKRELPRWVRATCGAIGVSCVALGYAGAFVPGMPSTVFFVCALWAFKQSSPRFEAWLLNHRIFGPTLRDWEANKAISKRNKIIAIVSMTVCVAVSLFFIKSIWIKGLVALLAVIGAAFIATRRSSPGPL